jgi:hypothetical protein
MAQVYRSGLQLESFLWITTSYLPDTMLANSRKLSDLEESVIHKVYNSLGMPRRTITLQITFSSSTLKILASSLSTAVAVVASISALATPHSSEIQKGGLNFIWAFRIE